jgi:ABC-type multidrug transport system fused ATPase/permease subunit
MFKTFNRASSCFRLFFVFYEQRYYFTLAKEVMRINGTTKSSLANHVAETVAGAATIRAFEEEDRSFEKNLDLIDINASAFFHSFASNEWLIQRLETISAVVLTAAALCMVMLPPGTFTSGENLVIIFSEICFYASKCKFLNFNILYFRNYWDGTILWPFIKQFFSIFDSKSMHSCKLHNISREVKSIYAYRK